MYHCSLLARYGLIARILRAFSLILNLRFRVALLRVKVKNFLSKKGIELNSFTLPPKIKNLNFKQKSQDFSDNEILFTSAES